MQYTFNVKIVPPYTYPCSNFNRVITTLFSVKDTTSLRDDDGIMLSNTNERRPMLDNKDDKNPTTQKTNQN